MSSFILHKKPYTFAGYFTQIDISSWKVSIKEKKSVKDEPFYEEDNNYIIGVGTYIYEGVTGRQALMTILHDFRDASSIARIKKKIKGLFSILINKNGCTYVFNDYYGLYDTYYCEYGDTYCVGNDIINLGKISGYHNIAEFPFIMSCFAGGNSSNESILSGIKKLQGNTYLFCGDNIKLNLIPQTELAIEIPIYRGCDEALSYLKEEINNITNEIHDCFGDTTLCATGGLDSRLVLAAFTSNGQPKVNSLIYGASNDFRLYTRHEDENIVKELSYITSIPHEIINWNSLESDYGLDMIWQKQLAETAGINNRIYLGNRRFVETIENTSSKFIEFGYFLEAIRLREWIEEDKKGYFTLDSYIHRYFDHVNLLDFGKRNEFFAWVKERYQEKLALMSIDCLDRIPISKANQMEWLCRERYTDSRMHQFINHYRYSFPIFAVPRLHEFILQLPIEEKYGARFQIKLIRDLNKSLLNANIFSHRRKYKINYKGEKVLRVNIKNIITLFMHKFPWVMNNLLPTWQRIHHKSGVDSNAIFIAELREIENNSSILEQSYIGSTFNGSVDILFSYRQALIALNSLCETDL